MDYTVGKWRRLLPSIIEAYTYLDELRESGATNMFGSGSYVKSEFDISETEAQELVLGWMGAVEAGTWDMDEHEFVEKTEA